MLETVPHKNEEIDTSNGTLECSWDEKSTLGGNEFQTLIIRSTKNCFITANIWTYLLYCCRKLCSEESTIAESIGRLTHRISQK